jgi:hypothetical protein
MVTWLQCFGPEMRQNTVVAGECGRDVCSPHGNQKEEIE